jgi:hypothetical protein
MSIWLEQEELLPEAFRFFHIVIFLVSRARSAARFQSYVAVVAYLKKSDGRSARESEAGEP